MVSVILFKTSNVVIFKLGGKIEIDNTFFLSAFSSRNMTQRTTKRLLRQALVQRLQIFKSYNVRGGDYMLSAFFCKTCNVVIFKLGV